jgi:hypothetical protein
MTAFASLLLLIFIASIAMCVVAYSNYRFEQNRKIRLKLQKLKSKVEQLEDIIRVLDRLCENKMITTFINDDVIELYERMIELSPNTPYIKGGHTNAKIRSDILSDASHPQHIDRICSSDAQIARCRAYLKEASNILRRQHSEGKFSATEIQEFTQHLEWLHLQIFVITNIAEGHKAFTRNDFLKANAFYKKAQNELLNSGHTDKRRQEMITQLADVLFGRRRYLDKRLMPEDEFNPTDEPIVDVNNDSKASDKAPNINHQDKGKVNQTKARKAMRQ